MTLKRLLIAWGVILGVALLVASRSNPDRLEEEHEESPKCPNEKRLEDDSILGCDRPAGHAGACLSSFETGRRPIP